MSVSYFVFSGTFHVGEGVNPAAGFVRIGATVRQVKDTAGKVLFSGTIKAPLDGQGTFSVALVHPATADPAGFGYTVTPVLNHVNLPPVTFAVANGVTALDWTEIVAVDPPDPIYSGATDGGGW